MIAGTVTTGGVNACGVVRYNANGSKDASFGTGGEVLVPMTVGCFSISQQPDGKIVLGGNNRVGDVDYATLVRLQLSGAPDTGFGTNGYRDISNFDSPGRVAFTSSGNLITSLTIQDPADGVLKSYVVQPSGTLAGPWVNQTLTFNALPNKSYRRARLPGFGNRELGVAGVFRRIRRVLGGWRPGPDSTLQSAGTADHAVTCGCASRQVSGTDGDRCSVRTS